MNDFELWEHIRNFGQITNTWWYDVAVLPATIMAGCAYLLTWVAHLRRKENLPAMFLWLAIASAPMVLILPSYYVSTSLSGALHRIGLEQLMSVQQLNNATTRQIGTYLNQLATLGIIGASLALALIFANTLRGWYTPPIIQTVRSLSQNISQRFTQRFGQRPRGRGVAKARHGVIRVLNGKHKGSYFGITNGAIIGKRDATMSFTDEIVSRRHAHFEIRDNLTYLGDEESTNGTYLVRDDDRDNLIEIDNQAFLLQPGDTIYLGHPQEHEAVQLIFEMPIGDL
jgi:hypothetical protein